MTRAQIIEGIEAVTAVVGKFHDRLGNGSDVQSECKGRLRAIQRELSVAWSEAHPRIEERRLP
jgi:hypothetical protein